MNYETLHLYSIVVGSEIIRPNKRLCFHTMHADLTPHDTIKQLQIDICHNWPYQNAQPPGATHHYNLTSHSPTLSITQLTEMQSRGSYQNGY